MRISFKNVGQGDSIVLEWVSKGVERCGIIDCNRFNDRNPVIEHLKEKGYRVLTFVFLTHPHADHFSGMQELFTYCVTNGIKINRFVHTLRSDPRFLISLNYANLDPESNRNLVDLLKQARNLYNEPDLKKRTIIEMGAAEVDWSIDLNPFWSIRNHSPSEGIVEQYLNDIFRYKNLLPSKCSKLANLLSSILCLEGSDHTKALLTADAEKDAFLHLNDRRFELFEGSLLLAQVPHHGSETNHQENFWQRFAKSPECPAAISAGPNKKYGHPDFEVVQSFASLGFSPHCTNDVHGFKTFLSTKRSLDRASALDDIGELVTHEDFGAGRDLVFDMDRLRASYQGSVSPI